MEIVWRIVRSFLTYSEQETWALVVGSAGGSEWLETRPKLLQDLIYQGFSNFRMTGKLSDAQLHRVGGLVCLQILGASQNCLNLALDTLPNLKILRITLSRPFRVLPLNCRQRHANLRILDFSNFLGDCGLHAILAATNLHWLRLHLAACVENQSVPINWDASCLDFLDVSCAHPTPLISAFVGDLIEFAGNFNPVDLSLPCLDVKRTALLGFCLKRLRNFCVLDWSTIPQPSAFTALIAPNLSTLQTLILHIKGESKINFDFLFWAIKVNRLPMLKRFEAAVLMDAHGELVAPEMTLEWVTYFRCMYKQNKYFRKKSYSVVMREEWYDVPNGLTPSKLFSLEIGVPPEDWQEFPKSRRLDYVDILDFILSQPPKQEPQFIPIIRE